jgi:MFS family permease
VALLFLTNGAVPVNLVPLFPSIKSGLGLSNAEFGFAIAIGPIGALSSGLLAGILIRRFRSSRVAVAGMIVASFCALLAGIAPTWALLAVALFLVETPVVGAAGAGGGRRVTIRWATWATLLALGLIGVCGSIVEDSGGVLLERSSSNLTKSGDNTAQVVAHHGFGLLGLASAHRIDDRHVLG